MSTAPADIPGDAARPAEPGLSDYDPDDAVDDDDPAPGETARGGSLVQDLADVLRAAGLVVEEVEGWKTRQRGGAGYSAARPLGIIIHHTASPKRWDGRRDVDYMTFECENKPLANLYLDRQGRWWVLAAGATNTNGKGGPFRTLPQNGANSRVLGIEAGNDGIGEKWPDVMQDSYVKGVAALAEAYRIPTDHVLSHQEWAPTRKVDPAGPSRFGTRRGSATWNMDAFRAEVAKTRGQPIQPLVIDTKEETGDVVAATTYVVQPGDTWWGIADKLLGDPRTTWPALAAANGGPSRVLHPGQVLRLPGGGGGGGAAVPAFPGVAREGDRGEVPAAWQKALIARKVISDNQDNRDRHYGAGMRAAVQRLQRSWGWSDADGVADERTWARLHGASSG
jgi:LysM repeat protein